MMKRVTYHEKPKGGLRAIHAVISRIYMRVNVSLKSTQTIRVNNNLKTMQTFRVIVQLKPKDRGTSQKSVENQEKDTS